MKSLFVTEAFTMGSHRRKRAVRASRSLEGMELPIAGGCGCGAVRFEVSRPFVSAAYCHCTRCQRRTGAGAAATARAEPGTVRITQGKDELHGWAPEGGREKVFCVRCGSGLFSRAARPHPS